jgi:hypothetical protein
MTVSDLIQYFGDGDMFPDPKQDVKFTFCPDGATPLAMLDIRSTTVPEEGEAVVELKPAPKKRFMFSLKFEANPVIEATSVEEAEAKAYEMMKEVQVVRDIKSTVVNEDGAEMGLRRTTKPADDFVAQEPYMLEEVKE